MNLVFTRWPIQAETQTGGIFYDFFVFRIRHAETLPFIYRKK
jgi:hypothetical protein